MFGLSDVLYGIFLINAIKMSSNRHSTSSKSFSDSLWSLNISADTTERIDNIAESQIDIC